MIKLIYTLLFILPLSAISQVTQTGFEVLLDRETSRVGEGKCLVYGTVKDNYGNIVTSGSIVTMQYKKQAKIKEDGSFSLVVSDTDSMVFFVGSTYREISIGHAFRSKHKVKLAITTKYQEVALPEKPVIYLYSEKEKEVSIQLNPTNGFLFSYPEYNDGWKVSIDSSGEIIHKGRAYPYLFWEGNKQRIDLAKTETTNELMGFFIETDTVITFLENQLSALGLNRTEATDFITYWGPRITKTRFAFIQFTEKEAYENNIASIKVEPQPESIQRVFMIFKGISSATQFQSTPVVPQTFTPFKRKGYTLIEWGGAEINQLEFVQ